jgi:hypothetical protein
MKEQTLFPEDQEQDTVSILSTSFQHIARNYSQGKISRKGNERHQDLKQKLRRWHELLFLAIGRLRKDLWSAEA